MYFCNTLSRYAAAEVLKLISFESISILKGNFGQLLHL
jgi:hypothetical protein